MIQRTIQDKVRAAEIEVPSMIVDHEGKLAEEIIRNPDTFPLKTKVSRIIFRESDLIRLIGFAMEEFNERNFCVGQLSLNKLVREKVFSALQTEEFYRYADWIKNNFRNHLFAAGLWKDERIKSSI